MHASTVNGQRSVRILGSSLQGAPPGCVTMLGSRLLLAYGGSMKQILRPVGMLGALLLLASLQPALLGAHADPPASPAPVCTVSEASAQFAEGRFAESAETLRRTVAADPGCAPAAYLLAESLMRLGRAKESLAAYTAAARLRIPVAADLRHVALDYALLPDYAGARRWAQRARDLEPQNAENWYVLGRIDYSDGNLTAAVSSFQQAAVLDPGSVKVQNNLAGC